MNLNLFNLIIISGVIQGIIFTSVILFNEKYKSDTSKFIALVVLFLSLSNLQYWLIENNITDTRYIFVPWQWLIMPMFYIFVHKYLKMGETGFKTKAILFLPFFLIIVLHVAQVYLSRTTSYRIPSHFERGFFLYLDYGSFAFNFTIVFIVHKRIKAFNKRVETNSKNNMITTDWLIRLLYIGFFICIAWLIALTITLYLNKQNKYFFYALWLSISFLVYWLGYAAIYQLNIYKEREDIFLKQKEKIPKVATLVKTSPIFDKFQQLIIEKELFLNPTLKQSKVAQMMNITTNYLSKILNEEGTLNFNDYINELRIRRAKDLLLCDEFSNYTNTAIGLESGFNSRSTFFKAFKKHTGKTPSEYKKQVQKKLSPKY